LIREFDYDLHDVEFQNYCVARGTLHAVGAPGSLRWDYVAGYHKTKTDFLAEPYFQYSEELNGSRHRYTTSELDSDWLIVQLARAKMQDCWELYCKSNRAEAS
jgi:hypothetical protein